MQPAAVRLAARSLRRLDALDAPPYRHTTHALAVRRGETVLAHHRRPEDELCDLFSVTKSVVSTLAGIARDRGALALDDPVGAHLPGLALDERLTLRHLLTMTAGRQTDGPYDIDAVIELPRGWLARVAAAPQLRAPGERFSYDNGAAHLLAGALQAALGEPLFEFAERELFAPLGLRAEWPLDPDGLVYGFGHLRMRPRDLVALGELYLADGAGLVSAEYVAEATAAQSAGGPPEHDAYGHLWWVAPERGLFYAGGYAGQALVVVPGQELVVVVVGEEALLEPGWRPARELVLSEALRRL